MEKLHVQEEAKFLLPIKQKHTNLDFDTGNYLKNLLLSISSLCPNHNVPQDEVRLQEKFQLAAPTHSICNDDEEKFLEMEQAWPQDCEIFIDISQITADCSGGNSPESALCKNGNAVPKDLDRFFALSDADTDSCSSKGTEATYRRSSDISHINCRSKKIQKETKNCEIQERSGKIRARRKLWKPEEDSQLLYLFAQHGPKWTLIGSIIGNRSGKQVRDRYLNNLCPNIINDEWKLEEDELLIELYQKLGSKWLQIAKQIPGRSENQVKNRFYAKKRWYRQNGFFS